MPSTISAAIASRPACSWPRVERQQGALEFRLAEQLLPIDTSAHATELGDTLLRQECSLRARGRWASAVADHWIRLALLGRSAVKTASNKGIERPPALGFATAARPSQADSGDNDPLEHLQSFRRAGGLCSNSVLFRAAEEEWRVRLGGSVFRAVGEERCGPGPGGTKLEGSFMAVQTP